MAQERPSFVFILADDMTYRDMARMDAVRQRIAGAGTGFSRAYTPTAMCCPSRATILTGQYAHNTGVYSNVAPHGSWQAFRPHEAETLATEMQPTYETALVGKYLNGWNPGDPEPVGWDYWRGTSPPSPDDPGTQLPALTNEAVNFIGKAHTEPYFLYLSMPAPHEGTVPSQPYNQLETGGVPRPPSFNEKDVSDKPEYIRNTPRIGPRGIALLDRQYRTRQQTLAELDDSVDKVLDALAQTGQMDNTYIVFTSDNGFHMGEHRLRSGKGTAYEEDIHVPLLIRGPGVAVQTQREIASNIDFAPTFMDLSGLGPMPDADGRSLAPLLGDDSSNDAPWRNALLLEAWGSGTDRVRYKGLRTYNYLYVRYPTTQERELYNTKYDPYQLRNLADKSPDLVKRLNKRTTTLEDCMRDACRIAENP